MLDRADRILSLLERGRRCEVCLGSQSRIEHPFMCALIQRQSGSWYAEQAMLTVHDAHSVSSENPIEPCEPPSATQNLSPERRP